ncbi:hypothetical protein K439DRAFT_1618213 [Ramaria rubella]|nr:hypothetical protein K439DRAFT_1618213 [Ramaria rubella]
MHGMDVVWGGNAMSSVYSHRWNVCAVGGAVGCIWDLHGVLPVLQHLVWVCMVAMESGFVVCGRCVDSSGINVKWCLACDMVWLCDGGMVEAVAGTEGHVCTTGTWVWRQMGSCWKALGLPLVLVHVSQLGVVEMGTGLLLSLPCAPFSAVWSPS